MKNFFLFLSSVFLLAGCHVERIVLEEPVRDRFVEVDTEDHVVVRLDEDAETGYLWRAECKNAFVNITIEREPELATVHLRVRRGFVGPAVVYLRQVQRWSGTCARAVKLQLHRRHTHVAAWR